jgi:hypothetical protein
LDVALNFGGPAGCGANNPVNWIPATLTHLNNGTNVWTGAPARVDWLSMHYKGGGSSSDEGTGAAILRGELDFFAQLSTQYPNLARVPFADDEACV